MQGAEEVGQGGNTSRQRRWSDDVVAPRQEVDTLSLLYQEASIQDALVADEVTAANFLKRYRDARAEYRGGARILAASPKVTNKLTQEVLLFGRKASACARRQPGSRVLITCSGPDEPGRLAPLVEAIADEGKNILGAFMSVVAGHLVTAILSTGPDTKPEGLRDRLQDMRIAFTRLTNHDVDWPRPGSTCWHAIARYSGEASLLLELTQGIRAHGLPLVALSSWLESGEGTDLTEVVDLNFAVEARPQGADLVAVREVEALTEESLPGVQIDIVPVTWPTRYRSDKEVVKIAKRDVVCTAVGHAQPGFVHDVLLTIAQDVGAVVDVRGCSMAILDGVSVVTIVFTSDGRSEPDEIERQLKTKLANKLRLSQGRAPLSVSVVGADAATMGKRRSRSKKKPTRDGIDRPTHELNIRAAEQPRIVARVARLVADLGINITWFVSYVLEPVLGERWPVCAVQMHLHVPPKSEVAESDLAEELGRQLRSLAEAEGWQEATLRPWSLGR